MMKKNGFTLAEVLITLAIIGVVATLTLPSLMTNTAQQQAMTAFKKMMNTLNEAGQMNAALEGFDYSNVNSAANGGRGTVGDSITNGDQTLTALFNERLQISRGASGNGYGVNNAQNHCTGAPVIALRDGMAICLGAAQQDANNGPWQNVWVDTNGQKGPNQESTCLEEGCLTKNQRRINDQFIVTLYNGVAMPGRVTIGQNNEVEAQDGVSFASRYAMGIERRAGGAGGQ